MNINGSVSIMIPFQHLNVMLMYPN